MTPEQKARQKIDELLTQAGWVVQDFADMDSTAGLGVAVREFQLKTGAADYLLYTDGKATGVVEAKPEGHTLTGVETQSAKYTEGLPKNRAARSGQAGPRNRFYGQRAIDEVLPGHDSG